MDAELVYAADPMCSWCYGFAPELEHLLSRHSIPMRLVMGGLWVGGRTQPLTEALRRYLHRAWTNVHERSGQPFSFDLLMWDDWEYDTEPACRAVVTMRRLHPESEHRFFSSLQYAFYAENRDITDAFVFPELLESFPVDTESFMLTYHSMETEELTRADFAAARDMGALGFPTLFLRQGGEVTPLTRGYKRAGDLERTLEMLVR